MDVTAEPESENMQWGDSSTRSPDRPFDRLSRTDEIYFGFLWNDVEPTSTEKTREMKETNETSTEKQPMTARCRRLVKMVNATVTNSQREWNGNL